MTNSLTSPHILNVADLRTAARARLPNVVFDYLDGAAEQERTLADNMDAFDGVMFKPRLAVKIPQVDLSTRVLGVDIAFPALLAPIGYSRMMHPRGERAAAAGAARAGTGYILSTISGHSMENVRSENENVFFQLYLMGGREASERTIARAQAAGYKALFLTIDTAVAGMREKDFRNGMTQLMGKNPFRKIRYLPNLLAHPRWLAGFLLDGGMPALPNAVGPDGPIAATNVAAALESAAVCWSDLEWIRKIWKGPIAIKGIQMADDARRAVDEGASAVVVSNHGGRQLDGVPGSLRVLPSVVEAVGSQCEVLFDSGIRRGSDIVKAMALGAKAVLIGRGYAYGMAAAGDTGVDRAIMILRNDLIRTLKLLGCASIHELDGSYLTLRPGFRAD
jgi:isopentenyl diphosphate isomerase/L-lactate dehydrogenase-like FMN-dependent dehydrogenase